MSDDDTDCTYQRLLVTRLTRVHFYAKLIIVIFHHKFFRSTCGPLHNPTRKFEHINLCNAVCYSFYLLKSDLNHMTKIVAQKKKKKSYD